jgi:GGDEF domain-containing protein
VNSKAPNERAASGDLLDLDHFKQITDIYGPLLVIRRIHMTKMVSEACGRTIIGRYGGDEFVICYRAAIARKHNRLLNGCAKKCLPDDGHAPGRSF